MKIKRLHISIVCLIVFFFLTQTALGGSLALSSINQNQIPIQHPHNSSDLITTSPYGGSRYNIQGWIYINIHGMPYIRGHQYGYLAAEEIIDLMQRWGNMILNHPRIQPIRPLLTQEKYENIAERWWNFLKNTAYNMYWHTYPDEYKEEVIGIAEGINARGLTLYGKLITYEDILASNQMYEMLSKITDKHLRKSIHPLFTLFALIKPTISEHINFSAEEFIADFIPATANDIPNHRCSGFIATGNATKNNEIILGHSIWATEDGGGMWWWSYYIAIRWNIILDVIPLEGYRFQMPCAPGYIWSDHVFYQNEKGIMFLETTLPQGIWTKKGIPLSIRSRAAVQYSNSIDDVMMYLKTNTDGGMNAVWLIGDTKTGEIARYELGLYHDAVIERTTDGFQWSTNNPMDFWVRIEKMNWKSLIKNIIFRYLYGIDTYRYYTPRYLPASRDIAFEELGNKHYGDIDIDLVKDFMSMDPIGTYSPDCKIASTSYLNHNGIMLHTGHPGGKILPIAYFDSPDVYYDTIEPVGWAEVFGLPQDHDVEVIRNHQETQTYASVEWQVNLAEKTNDFYSFSTVVDDSIYTSTSNETIYAISSDSGDIMWTKQIGKNPTQPVVSGNQLFVGSKEGLHYIHLGWLTTGTKPIGDVCSTPIAYDGFIYVGTRHHGVYCLNQETGMIVWQKDFNGASYLSNIDNDLVIVAANQTIYALHIVNGSIAWMMHTNGIITTPPYQEQDVVYAGSWDSKLYALNQSSGNITWSFETGWGIETTPTVTNDLVLFGSHDHNIYALYKETGEIHWVFSCRAAIHTNPVIFQDSILIGSDDGRLYRLDKETGSVIWIFAPGHTILDASRNYRTTPIRSLVGANSNKIFIGLLGHLYCIQ
ncbi:MAG: PQQ-binding-like beta-propeller repeat protein [Thermoplasmatota archaeon]